MSEPIIIKSITCRDLFRSTKTTQCEALEEAVAAGADLEGANLGGANLAGADLEGANLGGADLARADLARADLAGANLTDASLAGASLAGANLAGADLEGANLGGANLTDADLAPIRLDLEKVLSSAPAEVPGLLAALREGRIDGSQYQGACACLVGTIANVRGVRYTTLPGLEPDSSRPAERWFLAIREGDTPPTNPVAAITEAWITDWLAAQ